MNLVSVVIPVYNRRRYLPEALDSVCNQKFAPLEVLVVDDGSTDGSADVALEWAEEHRDAVYRIKVLQNNHRGASAARNAGLEAANGSFVQFLDSDDIIHPDKLSEQVPFLTRHQDYDCVFAGYARFNGEPDWDQDPLPALEGKVENPVVSCIKGNCWQTSCGLYRLQSCLAIGGWNEALPVWQDIDFNIRFHKAGFRSFYIRRLRSLVRSSAAGRVSERHYSNKGIAAILSRVSDLRKELTSQTQNIREVEALTELAFGLYIRALKCEEESLREDALKELSDLSGHISLTGRGRLYVARVLHWLPSAIRKALWRTIVRLRGLLSGR